MMVPFGIGVGDFIAVAKLAKDIVRELKKDSQAVSHYQHLVVELESLDSALARINEIKPAEHKLIHLEAIRAAAAACEGPLQKFLERLEKYDSTMSTWNAPDKHLRGVGDRVKYGFDIWGDVNDLRNILASHIATINLLLLAQSLTSLSAAENDRAEISTKVTQSTALIQEVNQSQMSIGTDLEAQKKALSTLQGSVDEAKSYHIKSDAAVKTLAEAIKILQETVEQSQFISSQIQSKSNIETDDKETLGINSGAAAPNAEHLESAKEIGDFKDLNVQDTKEVIESSSNDELRAELECLKLKFESTQIKFAAASSSSILATTSKILNLVLSGIMVTTAWTLMNQSREIANLSMQLIQNCTMDRGVTLRPIVATGSQRLPGKPDDTQKNPEDITQEPLKPPTDSASGKVSTSFVVCVEDLSPNVEKVSSSFSSQDLWEHPDGPGNFCIGESTFFRWSSGTMEKISKMKNPLSYLYNPSREPSVHSVVSLITQPRKEELLVADFDAGRQIILDADRGGKRKWRHLSLSDIRPLVPLSESASSSKQPFRKTNSVRYIFIGLEGDEHLTKTPLPDHIVPQLLPERYSGRSILRKMTTAGIVGSLPLLIALAAFSAPPGRLKDVLTYSIRPGKWVPHDYPSGRDRLYRGMTVTIYYDPSNPEGSNKERLDGIQDGKDGPFYGFRPPSPENQAQLQPSRKENAAPRASEGQVRVEFE